MPPTTKIKLDLNNQVFQRHWMNLDKQEAIRILDTLKKIQKLSWDELYRDQGLKWEKITSVKPPKGIDAIYSLRITKSRRATAIRQEDFIRFMTIEPDHDATYGKK